MNLDSRKIGLVTAAAVFALLFAMPTMAASPTQPAAKALARYTGPLAVEIGCQIGPCGTTNIYIEPYVSANDPTYVSGNFFGLGGVPDATISTALQITGVTTIFYGTTYTAHWIKDPYPGDYGVTPRKTLSVNILGIVQVFAPDGTFLSSYSARVTFYCQNLNGNIVFLNTHPDVWGTTESGTLTDNFAALVSCST